MKTASVETGRLNSILVGPSGDGTPEAAVILCHGFGAPGQDLVPIGRELSRISKSSSKALFVFPAAPIELDADYDGRAWWMIDVARLQYLMAIGQTREMRSVNPPELPECRKMIFEIIAWVKQTYSLPPSKIIVGGFSQGAMLMTDVALNYGEPLGGLIIWSGALISEDQWRLAAEKQSSLNVVQTHGESDSILSITGARDLRSLLTAAGHEVAFTEFDGPHTITMEGIEMADNLISQVVG